MSRIDYEAEYNNRRRVPEYAQISARWSADSLAYRSAATSRSELDVPYGPLERHRFDAFHPASATGSPPIVMFVHGGYWQRGDRKEYSFIARPFNERGLSVVIPSYSLCPSVGVIDIVAELAGCIVQIWRTAGRKVVVCGNSAGGHLTASLLAVDWAKARLPADLVVAGYAISGIYDLQPLIPTSINEPLKLTRESAHRASPIVWPAPRKGAELVAAVGGSESAEFLRQARAIVEAWGKEGVRTEYHAVPGANHFTVLDELVKPDSAMAARIVRMAVAG